MAQRMNKEQVFKLELLGGTTLINHGRWELVHGSQETMRTHVVNEAACAVANGVAPLALYQWAFEAYNGNVVPTVSQWAAATLLVKAYREGSTDKVAIAKLCDVIDPPTLEPCPYCGDTCAVGSWLSGGLLHVRCVNVFCPYSGPAAPTKEEAERLHNVNAPKLRV